MSVQAKLDAIENVDIDTGRFKYVLIKVYYGENDEFKHIVRGKTWGEFHADIYENVYERIKPLGFDTECIGGGRILHDKDKHKITVYGYSQGYGRADHSLTCELIKQKYAGYDVTWSNEGY